MFAASNGRVPVENYKKKHETLKKHVKYNLFPINYNMDETVGILLGKTSLIENDKYWRIPLKYLEWSDW